MVGVARYRAAVSGSGRVDRTEALRRAVDAILETDMISDDRRRSRVYIYSLEMLTCAVMHVDLHPIVPR